MNIKFFLEKMGQSFLSIEQNERTTPAHTTWHYSIGLQQCAKILDEKCEKSVHDVATVDVNE